MARWDFPAGEKQSGSETPTPAILRGVPGVVGRQVGRVWWEAQITADTVIQTHPKCANPRRKAGHAAQPNRAAAVQTDL